MTESRIVRNIRALQRRKDAPTASEATPEERRRAHWEEEDRRKDLLARAMRNAMYGPDLSKDEMARTLRDEAIRISQRRNGAT